MYDSQIELTYLSLLVLIYTGNSTPAQNSTNRSISPNTANNNNNNNLTSINGHSIQSISPQTPSQIQTSSSASPQHLLNNSLNLGSVSPSILSSPQQQVTQLCTTLCFLLFVCRCCCLSRTTRRLFLIARPKRAAAAATRQWEKIKNVKLFCFVFYRRVV